MPIVKTLADRVDKFTKKTPPDQTGTRYGAVKDLAVGRFIEGAGLISAIRERARIVLESEGVPSGDHGVYYAFVQKALSYAMSHSGQTLAKIIEGLKSWFTSKGCDPSVLEKLASLITG